MSKIKWVIKSWCCYCINDPVDNTAYWSSWSWSCKAPTQNAVYTKLQWVKEFNPSNTWSNWQILQKTSNWYAWCNNSSSWAIIKPTNRVRCYCSWNTNSEQTYTIPNDWIICVTAYQNPNQYWTAYVTINNWNTCVWWIYNSNGWTQSTVETVRSWYVIKANSTCWSSAWNWSFLYTSF